MAVGRPCIAVKFGGHAEFLKEEIAYCPNYRLVPARFNYSGCGVWADPNHEEVIELMRHVYDHRQEAQRRGRRASEAARAFTVERSVNSLLEILIHAGMVNKIPG